MTTNDFGLGTRIPASKLRPPRLRHTEITRAALLGSDEVATAEVLAIGAPAGYGKSTLAIQWAARSPNPVAWVTCDATDRDPLIFMSSLGAALQQAAAGYTLSLTGATLDEPGFSHRVLPEFRASVAEVGGPVWVVVDDAHRLQGAGSARVLAAFVDALPIGSRVAIVGRELPDVPWALWRGQGRVADVGARELGFTPAETAQALQQYRGRPPAPGVAERVHRSTDGWPVAVYLSSRLPDSAIPARMSGIEDYIRSEVLGTMDEQVRRFVGETAVLDHLTPAIAAAVTGDEYAGRLLDRAVRSTGLIRQSGADSWQCHRLLRECALAELARQDPARVGVLHTRAADWYAGHSYTEQAVQQALASGDPGTMDRVVWPAAELSLLHGRAQTVQLWFDRIGGDTVSRSVDLSVMAGWAAAARGDHGGVLQHMENALSILPPDWLADLRAVPAAPHLALLLATAGPGVDNPARAVQLSRAALDALTPDDPIRALTHTVQGLNLALLGDDGAEAELRRAAALARATRVPSSEVEALSLLGMVLLADGRQPEGLRAIAEAEQRFDGHDLGQMTSTAAALAPSRLARAAIHGTEADIAAARAEVARVGPDIDPVLPWFRPLAGAVLAFADARTGRLDAFAEHLARCRGSQAPPGGLCLRWARLARQEFDRASRLSDLTPAELRVWRLLHSRLTLTEIAEDLYLSRETVKSHSVSIYRKLGVASRREAQDLADSWG